MSSCAQVYVADPHVRVDRMRCRLGRHEGSLRAAHRPGSETTASVVPHGSRTSKPSATASATVPVASMRSAQLGDVGVGRQLDRPATQADGVWRRAVDASAVPDVQSRGGGGSRRPIRTRPSRGGPVPRSRGCRGRRPALCRCRPRGGAGGPCAEARRRCRWAARRRRSRGGSRSPAGRVRGRSPARPATARGRGPRPARCRCRRRRADRSPRACRDRRHPGSACVSSSAGPPRAPAPRASGTAARSGTGRRGGLRARPADPRAGPRRPRHRRRAQRQRCHERARAGPASADTRRPRGPRRPP